MMGLSIDREKVVERIHEAIDMGVCVDLFIDVLNLLKEQEEQIERLEHDLAVAQNNLNYYVNGND